MKVISYLLFIIYFIIISISIAIVSLTLFNGSNIKSNNSTIIIVSSTPVITPFPYPVINGTDPIVPSPEYIKKMINWSNYHLLSNGYIYDCELSPPTPSVNHSFLHATIHVDVKDTNNSYDILKEMAGIVKEEREIIGPDSFPNVWGFVDGGRYYYVWMWPYDNVVYATSSYGEYEKYTF